MELGIFKRQPEAGYLWSLVIGKNWVEAGIWRVIGEKTEIVSQGGASSWQEDNSETLISAADSTLSAAAASLEDDAPEPTNAVLGLPPSWVENGEIKKERLELLKKLCRELELKPAGFVVIPEAIVHFLKAKEGALLNAILVGLSEDSIDLSLVQGGKILGTVEVAKSMSLGQDMAEGLARLPTLFQYPSRILLYNHRAVNLDEARQNLIKTEWKDFKILFLHTPKVEILPEDAGILAVSLAGGTEVGHATALVVPKEETEEEGEKPRQEELEEVSIEELGFLKGADVAKTKPPPSPQRESADEEPEAEDIVRKKEEPEIGEEPTKKFLSLPRFSLPKRDWAFSPPTLPTLAGFRFLWVFGLILVFLAGSLGVAYWYLPKAKVLIYVAPKVLEKSIEFRVDPNLSSVNQDERIVPAKLLEIPVSGEKTGQPSGTKTVGERAGGQVIIYNTGGATTLKSGTAVIGPNSLKFSLDEDAPVASGSSSANPSKTTVKITASDIGNQYNLAAGTEFSVGNFAKSAVSAKNEEAFLGGTSREVSAVSKEDIEVLERELSKELFVQGMENLKSTLGEDEILIEESGLFQKANKTLSNKAGEEASTIKLKLEGRVLVSAVPRSALSSFVQSEVEGDVPDGFTLRQDQIEVSYQKKAQEAKEKVKEQPKFVAQVKANLLPKVDPDKIARAIAGKYPEVAKNYLSSNIPGFTRAEISANIRLPGKLGTLPRIPKNIKVEVAAER